ncbi:MAG: chloride channel protein [Phycisphaerales bacterium]
MAVTHLSWSIASSIDSRNSAPRWALPASGISSSSPRSSASSHPSARSASRNSSTSSSTSPSPRCADGPSGSCPRSPWSAHSSPGASIYFFARGQGPRRPRSSTPSTASKSRIRPRVAVIKAIASATTIGSGGSAGAEGPIVQIGSAIGSGIAQLLRVNRDQATTLLGCGAAAGISSVFNAPIAGVFFVLEIILKDFSLRTFTPIVIASVLSAGMTQAFHGTNDPIFSVPEALVKYNFTIEELPSYLFLGVVCGFLAVAFVKSLYKAEDIGEIIPAHPIIRPAVGALLVGILGIVFLFIMHGSNTNEIPPFFGNGYETIRSLINPHSYSAGEIVSIEPDAVGHTMRITLVVVIALTLCKLLATCFTLGSGGSGGVFAPSLFMGAAGGAAVGELLDTVGLLPDKSSPASYALVGMAAMVAGTTHAPLTAILILYELTRDAYVLLPIMLAAVMSVVVAQLLMRDSIYSLKLRRRGVLTGTAADLSLLRRLSVRDVALVPHVGVHAEDPLSKLLELRDVYKIVDFVVVDHEGNYKGLVTAQDLRTALIEREAIPYLLVEELLRPDLPTVDADEPLDTVLDKFSIHDVSGLAVVDASSKHSSKVTGLLTRGRLMKRYQSALRES